MDSFLEGRCEEHDMQQWDITQTVEKGIQESALNTWKD